LQYGLSRWDALTRYIEDGRLSIDNNLAERLLRGTAVTRKNFLFPGSNSGGDRAAILYTAIETAKLNDLDPAAYLASVLGPPGAWSFQQPPRGIVALELHATGNSRLTTITPPVARMASSMMTMSGCSTGRCRHRVQGASPRLDEP
jgi:hypothetical protein